MPTKLTYQQPYNINNNNEATDENDGPMNNSLVSKGQNGMDAPTPDPIYYTIADKGGKASMMRNCVSLENLGGLTIRNDLSGTMQLPGDPHFNDRVGAAAATAAAIMQQNFNNARVFHSGFGTMYQQYPSSVSTNMQYNDYWNWSRFGYGGFTNPNPYVQSRSNTNSKQSLGSDDYRKYRDVAL